MPNGSYEYSLDTTGNLAANKIINEDHTVTKENDKDYNFIIPRYAPYHAGSLRVFLKEGNSLTALTEGTDWNPSLHFTGASLAIGRPIYGAVSFNRPDFEGEVRIEYQTLGGQYTLDEAGIAEILANIIYNPRGLTWEKITNLPTTFAPTDHPWNFEDMVGMREIKEALLKIEEAILSKDFSKWETHITNFNNPHKVTKAQVGLGKVENYPPATVAEAIAGTKAEAYLTPATLKAVLDKLGLLLSSDTLVLMLAHLKDFNNPHRVEKSQVGLSNVENLPPVTPGDILARRSVRKYVTLDQMMQYLALYGCTPGSDLKDIEHPPKGALLSIYCNNVNRMGVYADGNGGSYEEIIEVDSERCGYVEQKPIQYPERGTLLSAYCVDADKFGLYADGYGGTFQNLIEMNHPDCGQGKECPEAGTELSRRCDGTTLVREVADGKCGKTELKEENSKACEEYPAAGTELSRECDNTTKTLYGIYADGRGGTYKNEIEKNSKECGAPTCTKDILIKTSCQGTTKIGHYQTGNYTANGQCEEYTKELEQFSKDCGAPVCTEGAAATPAYRCDGTRYIERYLTGARNADGTCAVREVDKGEVDGKCGYTKPVQPVHPAKGTVLSQSCSGTTNVVKIADGNGGSTTENRQYSSKCGFKPRLYPDYGGYTSKSGNTYTYKSGTTEVFRWKGSGLAPNTTYHLAPYALSAPQSALTAAGKSVPYYELQYYKYWIVTTNSNGEFTWTRDLSKEKELNNPDINFNVAFPGSYTGAIVVQELANGTGTKKTASDTGETYWTGTPRFTNPLDYSEQVTRIFPALNLSMVLTINKNNQEVIIGTRMVSTVKTTLDGTVQGLYGLEIIPIAAGIDGLVPDRRTFYYGENTAPYYETLTPTSPRLNLVFDGSQPEHALAKDGTIRGKHSYRFLFREHTSKKIYYSNYQYVTYISAPDVKFTISSPQNNQAVATSLELICNFSIIYSGRFNHELGYEIEAAASAPVKETRSGIYGTQQVTSANSRYNETMKHTIVHTGTRGWHAFRLYAKDLSTGQIWRSGNLGFNFVSD